MRACAWYCWVSEYMSAKHSLSHGLIVILMHTANHEEGYALPTRT